MQAGGGCCSVDRPHSACAPLRAATTPPATRQHSHFSKIKEPGWRLKGFLLTIFCNEMQEKAKAKLSAAMVDDDE